MTRFSRRYRRIARTLSNAELMHTNMGMRLTSRELLGSSTDLFLDFYGDGGIRLALERYGLIDALERKGLANITVRTRFDDHRHTLFVYGRPREGGPKLRLVELVARRDRLVPHVRPPAPAEERSYQMLTIEWLCMRHPRRHFSPRRPRLPGQDAPGLGLGEQVLELLCRTVERLGLDGLVAVPAYFHAAVLYALELPFFDPWYGGQLEALQATLLEEEDLSLAQASWAVEWGLVCREDGETFRWHGEGQVWPTNRELAALFRSEPHRAATERAAELQRFFLDREGFDARWEEEREVLEGRR